MGIGIIDSGTYSKAALINALTVLLTDTDTKIVVIEEEPMPTLYITNVYENHYDVRPFKFDNTEPWQEFKHSPYKSKKASIKRKKRK